MSQRPSAVADQTLVLVSTYFRSTSSNLRMSEDQNRLSQAQAQVGEVVDIMRVNVEKVLERDNKLSELDQRADNLQEGANQFQTQVGAIIICDESWSLLRVSFDGFSSAIKDPY